MNMQQLAATLNGRTYRNEITEDEEREAASNKLVVVTGYSDDNMEFRGAINDEFGCYEGGSVLVSKNGILTKPDKDELDEDEYEEAYENYKMQKPIAKKVTAVWCPKKLDCSWLIKSEIPHATFDIMEDGELYCRGIVFSLDSLELA